MCGIVGYTGHKNAPPFLLDGLEKLEYRGYDSAGIAVCGEQGIQSVKACGRLKNLVEKFNAAPVSGCIGIGHTRWATHGVPSDQNSHPHLSRDLKFAVVHNGIIENYTAIKQELCANGYRFSSETDSETVAHLLDFYYSEGLSLKEAVFKAVSRLEGAYALGIICSDFKDTLIAVRKDCPLVIGVGENENFIASDIPALLNYTRNVYFLNDNESAFITPDSIEILDRDGKSVTREIYRVEWDVEAAEKGGYEHFMLKEINEQPKIIQDLVSRRMPANVGGIALDDIKLDSDTLRGIDRIYIVACGTAYYAGMFGKRVIERLAGIPVEADVASEFRYRNPILDDRTLLIAVSQSGETADTLEAVRIAKQNGSRVLAIVNAVGSSIARNADDVFYILAGPEIAVASTKAFSAQTAAIAMLAVHLGLTLGTVDPQTFAEIRANLYKLPANIESILWNTDKIKALAQKYCASDSIFYIGRGADYVMANEGSLKLKEIAYKHSEAYAAGELKHGPIAMMESNTLLVALATQQDLLQKTISNIKEVKSRKAQVLAVTLPQNTEMESVADDVIYIPDADWLTAPILANVYNQLFAYYIALELGRDIDKPRNLAKSVTVE